MTKRDSQTAEERKLFLLCDEVFGKDKRGRDERIELAQYLLRRDVTSFSQLEPHQVCRLLDAVEGYQLITELRRQRGLDGAAAEDEQHEGDDRQDDEDCPQHG